MTEIAKWVLLLHVATTLSMVGLIWFVQIVHYPLFSRIGRDHFRRYEMDHQRLTTFLVLPLMFTELVTAVLLLWWRPDIIAASSVWGGLILLASVWLVTYTVQVPQHVSLILSYDPIVQRRLVIGNWVRTLAWTARGMLVIWMIGEVFSAMIIHPAHEIARNALS